MQSRKKKEILIKHVRIAFVSSDYHGNMYKIHERVLNGTHDSDRVNSLLDRRTEVNESFRFSSDEKREKTLIYFR